MGFVFGKIIKSTIGRPPFNNIGRTLDDVVNTGKKLVPLKPENKAAEKMGLAYYGKDKINYKWGYLEKISKKSIEGERSFESRNVLNYRNRVLAMPERQVTTKSGKTYTRTMGSTGERIYTDTNGNRIVFNDHRYKLPWQAESSDIYRITSNGSVYSISATKRGDKQEVIRYISNAPEHCSQTDYFKINNQGKVLEHNVDYYVKRQANPLYRSETIFGHPQNLECTMDNLHIKRTPQTPLWTSLKDYH